MPFLRFPVFSAASLADTCLSELHLFRLPLCDLDFWTLEHAFEQVIFLSDGEALNSAPHMTHLRIIPSRLRVPAAKGHAIVIGGLEHGHDLADVLRRVSVPPVGGDALHELGHGCWITPPAAILAGLLLFQLAPPLLCGQGLVGVGAKDVLGLELAAGRGDVIHAAAKNTGQLAEGVHIGADGSALPIPTSSIPPCIALSWAVV